MKSKITLVALFAATALANAQYSVDSNTVTLLTPTNAQYSTYAGAVQVTGNDYQWVVSPPGSPIYVWRVLFEPNGKAPIEAQFRQPNASQIGQISNGVLTYDKTHFNISDLAQTPQFLYNTLAATYLWASFPAGYFDNYQGKIKISRSPQYRTGTGPNYQFPFVGQSNIIEIVIGASLNTGEVNASREIAFYPNPAQDFIILKNDERSTGAVYDLSGKSLKVFEIQNGETRVDISHLPKGMYLLKLENGFTAKLIKK